MKTCGKCGASKRLEDFHKKSASKDGRRSYCKQCANTYMREYMPRHRDRKRAYDREYVQKNWDRDYPYRLANFRKRYARKLSLPSELVTIRDVALRDSSWCWLCGDELSDLDPSHMDHLIPLAADPELLARWGIENPGTVLANMALACPPCNIRKSNKILPCAIARYLRNLKPIEAAA